MCFHWHNDDLFFSCQKSSLTWIISLFHSTSSCETLTLCLTCYVTLCVSGLNLWQRWICDLGDYVMCDMLCDGGFIGDIDVLALWHTTLLCHAMWGVWVGFSCRAVKSYVRLHGTGLRSWWKWIHDFPCIFYDFFKHLTWFWNIWMKFCRHLDRCVFCW